MELEELKNGRHIMKAPAKSKTSAGGTSPMETSRVVSGSFIEMLKAEDARQLRALKRARPLWWAAAVLWTLGVAGILLSDVERTGSALPLRGLLALVFSGLAAAQYLQIRKLSAIDYAEPARVFLEKAAKRYQFMSTPYLILSLLITAVLALAASIYIVDVFARYLDIHDLSAGILATFAFVVAVYSFGYWATKKTWKKTRRPVLEEIRRMQDELQPEPE